MRITNSRQSACGVASGCLPQWRIAVIEINCVAHPGTGFSGNPFFYAFAICVLDAARTARPALGREPTGRVPRAENWGVTRAPLRLPCASRQHQCQTSNAAGRAGTLRSGGTCAATSLFRMVLSQLGVRVPCVSPLLVKIRRDLENQIRGLLKNLGLVIGRAKMNTFVVRAVTLIEARPYGLPSSRCSRRARSSRSRQPTSIAGRSAWRAMMLRCDAS